MIRPPRSQWERSWTKRSASWRKDPVSHFDDAPLHLLSSASLAWLQALRPKDQIDRRRFRPNLVIDVPGEPGRVEEGWIGHKLHIGEVVVSVVKPAERCVMITLAQDDLSFAPQVLKQLEDVSASLLGVYAHVITAGTLRVEDEVRVQR